MQSLQYAMILKPDWKTANRHLLRRKSHNWFTMTLSITLKSKGRIEIGL